MAPAAVVAPAFPLTPARALAAALATANSRACNGRYPIGGRIPPACVGASALAGKSTGTPEGDTADLAAPALEPKDATAVSATLTLPRMTSRRLFTRCSSPRGLSTQSRRPSGAVNREEERCSTPPRQDSADSAEHTQRDWSLLKKEMSSRGRIWLEDGYQRLVSNDVGSTSGAVSAARAPGLVHPMPANETASIAAVGSGFESAFTGLERRVAVEEYPGRVAAHRARP